MAESISERIVRLFHENKISEAGVEKAYEKGLISKKDYDLLVGENYEVLSSARPEGYVKKSDNEGSVDE